MKRLSARSPLARRCLSARGRPHPCDLSARAVLLGLALLGALACGADSDEDGADDAAEQNEPPSDVAPRGTGPAATDPEPSTGEDDADEDDAMPANPAAADPEEAPDEAPAAPGGSASNSSSLPPAPATAFAACTRRGGYGTNCDSVYVTMTQASPERCVQLVIDNCGDGYTSQGLPVDTPVSWKLSSASIGASPDECELGVFNPESTVVVDASGSIDWDAALPTALPTGIVLDVTLQPSSSADDTSSIDVSTIEPLSPASCEE
jgi:hypothetical protein